MPCFNARLRKTRVHASIAVAFGLMLAIGPLSGVRAIAVPPRHSEVIAQGVAQLSPKPIAWRVVLRKPDAGNEKTPSERHLGFVVPKSGTVLVTGSGEHDLTLLTAGEASFVREGETQKRDQVGETAAAYWSIELVNATDGQKADGGSLLSSGSKFTPKTGQHDIELVRDVLDVNEVSALETTTAPALLFVTSGSVGVVAKGGKPTNVKTGGTLAIAGAVIITAGGDGAAFVAARIGAPLDAPTSTPTTSPAIDSVATRSPSPAIDTAPTETSAPVPTEANTPAPTQTSVVGSIAVLTYLCPAGVTAEQATPAACGENSGLGSGAWSLSSSSVTGFIEPVNDQGSWLWSGLPEGDFNVTLEHPPAGYATFVIDPLPGTQRLGTSVFLPLSKAAPDVVIHAYFILPTEPPTGNGASLGLIFYDCPAGTTPETLNGTSDPGCIELLGARDVTLTGNALAQPLGAADLQEITPHPSLAGDWQWSGLAVGSYTLTAAEVAPGDVFYFVRPCGDQSCPKLNILGTSAAFDIVDSGFVIIVSRFPAP